MCHKILQVTVTPVSGSERPMTSMGAVGKKKSSLVPRHPGANCVDFDHARSSLCHVTSKGLHISLIRVGMGPENATVLLFIGQ